MNRNANRRLSNRLSFTPEELRAAAGGKFGPHFKRPTWKYISTTPQSAIDAATAAGYEVEQID